MKLALNVDDLTWRDPNNFATELTSIKVRRDDVLPVEVQFTRGVVAIELSGASTGELQLNADGVYGGLGIASDAAWDKANTGSDTVYTFALDLGTAAMDTAFTGDPASIDAMLELAFTDGVYTQSSVPLAVEVQNTIIAA